MPNLRSDQADILVGVNQVGIASTSWQSLTGGDVQATSLNTHPGNMLNAYSFGGLAQRSDATVSRLLWADGSGSDIWSYITDLEEAVGRNRMWISYTPLDQDHNPNGDKITMTGMLKGVQKSSWDANATAAATIALVMDCDLKATPTKQLNVGVLGPVTAFG